MALVPTCKVYLLTKYIMEKVRKNFKTIEALEAFISKTTLPGADVHKKALFVTYKRPIVVVDEVDDEEVYEEVYEAVDEVGEKKSPKANFAKKNK